jgi:hypothetical protein
VRFINVTLTKEHDGLLAGDDDNRWQASGGDRHRCDPPGIGPPGGSSEPEC